MGKEDQGDTSQGTRGNGTCPNESREKTDQEDQCGKWIKCDRNAKIGGNAFSSLETQKYGENMPENRCRTGCNQEDGRVEMLGSVVYREESLEKIQ